MSTTNKELFSGVFWSAIEKYSSMAIGLVISMILARLLSPKDFGVVAIATVIIFFLQIFCSMGIAPAIIQKKNLTKEDIDNIYSFTIYMGALLSLFLFIAAFYISNIYNNLILQPVCQILCIQVFFSAANMVPNALMLKDKRFKVIARRTVTVNVITGVISIVAAFKGLGVYSLLVSPVFSAICIYFWNKHYYPLNFYFNLSKSSIKKIYSYSVYLFLFEFVNYFSRNLDKLIIGKYLSVSSLGYYEKSYRLMQLPLNCLTSVFNPVLQPVLSEFQDDFEELCHKYENIIGFIASFSFPIGVFLFVCAEEIVVILFGDQWIPAVNCFKVLAISVPLQIILSTTGSIFQACNATKNLFYVGLRNSAMTIMGFLVAISLYGSIESVAWGWTITSFICFASTFFEFYFKIFHKPFKGLIKQFIIPVFDAICLIFFFNYIEVFLPKNIYYCLILKISFTGLITVLIMHVFGKFKIIKIIKDKK